MDDTKPTETSEAKTAKLFKSHMPYNRIQFGPELEAVFHKGRFSTTEPELIEKLTAIASKRNSMGIYIDPQETETSLLEPGTDWELRKRQLEEFMRNQSVKVDAGSTVATPGMKVATTSDSPTTGGRSAPAIRFSKEEVEALLKNKTAATGSVSTSPATTGTAVPDAAVKAVADTPAKEAK